MSYDPNDDISREPRDRRERSDNYDDFGEPRKDTTAAAKSKVGVPSTLILVCGILNLLACLGYGGLTGYIGIQDADKMKADQVRALTDARDNARKMDGGFKDIMVQTTEKALADIQQRDASGIKMQAVLQNGGSAVYLLLASLLQIFGGLRMAALKSYPLAMLASIFTILPCSLPGCCGLGQLAGIWGMVVLFNNEVKSAFK